MMGTEVPSILLLFGPYDVAIIHLFQNDPSHIQSPANEKIKEKE